MAAIVAPLADKKGLELSVHVADGVGPMVGDRRRVEQILLNLLSNAIKFTEAGSVKLDVAPADDFMPAGAAAQPALRLTVADTGIGIKPEDVALLFAPFARSSRTWRAITKARGLGWPSAGDWSNSWAARSKWRASGNAAVFSASRFR